jgi:hypothetical protein
MSGICSSTNILCVESPSQITTGIPFAIWWPSNQIPISFTAEPVTITLRPGTSNQADPCDSAADSKALQTWSVIPDQTDPNNFIVGAKVTIDYSDKLKTAAAKTDSFYFVLKKGDKCLSGPYQQAGIVKSISLNVVSLSTTSQSAAASQGSNPVSTIESNPSNNATNQPNPSPDSPPSNPNHNGLEPMVLTAIIACAVFILMGIVLLVLRYRRRKARLTLNHDTNSMTQLVKDTDTMSGSPPVLARYSFEAKSVTSLNYTPLDPSIPSSNPLDISPRIMDTSPPAIHIFNNSVSSLPSTVSQPRSLLGKQEALEIAQAFRKELTDPSEGWDAKRSDTTSSTSTKDLKLF